VLLLYPLGRLYGLVGLPLAIIGGVLCTIPVWWLGVRQSAICNLKDVIGAMLPPVLGIVMMIVVFVVGQILPISHLSYLVGTIWHFVLIGLACLAFLITIWICQQMIPHYSPLVDLQSILNRWRYSPSHLVPDRYLARIEPPERDKSLQ
jgi:hypothetical protein